jgi:hypothetical protein
MADFDITSPTNDPIELAKRAAMIRLQPGTLAPTVGPVAGVPAAMAPPEMPVSAPAIAAPSLGPSARQVDVSTPPSAPGLSASTLNPNDPKYTSLQPHGIKRAMLTLGAGLSGDAFGAERALYAPEVAYNRDVEAQKQQQTQATAQLANKNTQSEIDYRTQQIADLQDKPGAKETLAQLHADATAKAVAAGVDPLKDPATQHYADSIRDLQKDSVAKLTDEDKAISDRMASQKLPDTPANRDTVRKQLRSEGKTAPQGSTTKDDIKDTADAIVAGDADPTLSSYSFRDRTAIEAELHRRGFNQAAAQQDYKAVAKHLSSLNSTQQLRLNQALAFTSDTLPQMQAAYDKWSTFARAQTGFRGLSKAALAASKQLPGEAGSAATQLEAMISDLTSELGTVYKGGNSSTDESLKLAAQNLQGDWNDITFRDAMARIKKSLDLRQHSMNAVKTSGISDNSPYAPPQGDATTPVAASAPATNVIRYDAQGNRIKAGGL